MAETTPKSNNYGLAIAGGVSAVTGIALQVKPEDAVSNLSLWLEFFGVDRVPRFLATTQADTWGTAIGLALAALSFFIWWKRRNGQAKSVSGIWLQGHGLDHLKVSAVKSATHEAKFFPQESPRKRSAFDRLINGSCEDAADKVLADKVAKEEAERSAQHAYEIEKARQTAIEEATQKHSIERAMAEIQSKWFDEQPRRNDRRAELREERRLRQLETDKHRRALIASCRDLAHEFTLNSPEEQFRPFLEGHRTYADIRSHLSADFLSKLNAVRTTYSSADGARYPALVGWFLDDIDRLEKEWSL